MLVRNAEPQHIKEAAAKVGVEVYDLRPAAELRPNFRFTLRPIKAAKKPQRLYTKYLVLGREERRPIKPKNKRERVYVGMGGDLGANYIPRSIFAVCWHGHRDFFRELFKLAPQCKIETTINRMSREASKITYTAENFEQLHPSTQRGSCNCRIRLDE